MAQQGGRLTCPHCGANNFDTVTVCWKCNTPLKSSVGVSPPAASGMAGRQSYGSAPAENPYPPAAYAGYASASGDPNVARRAAIALALVIPWVGLPVGWVFMMIEDSRKQAIGRICVFWSVIALFLHLLFIYAATASAVPMLLKVMTAMQGAAQNSGRGTALPGGLDSELRGMNGGQ